ncbi:MAG: carboxylate-amine ligase [Myxococcota bacterium]
MDDMDFTIGIEEEYLLIDPKTRNLVEETPPGLLADCEKRVGGQVAPEFLQSQIEVGTRVCTTIREAREELERLRRSVIEVAANHGVGVIAASTHPFANWGEQRTTQQERYRILARDLQGVAWRLVISGMHVHIGIPDDHQRIDLMNQATYFLPHLLALSTSSPFWEGHMTGLMSYRIAVWDELPRSGLPEHFDTFDEFERHVRVLVKAGLIEDASKIWWDIRPSARFPTIEMRITDICTHLEDAVCVAALFRCLIRMLNRLRLNNQRWRTYARMLVSENRWLAQRYGFEKGLVDFGKGKLVPYAELAEELLELIKEDAEHFECLDEVRHVRTILKRGTSAHWQIKEFDKAKIGGATDKEALQAVVDMLVRETMHGVI